MLWRGSIRRHGSRPILTRCQLRASISHSISLPLSSHPEAARPPLLNIEAVEQPNSKPVGAASRNRDGRSTARFVGRCARWLPESLNRRSLWSDSVFVVGLLDRWGKVFGVWSAAELRARGMQRSGKGRSLCPRRGKSECLHRSFYRALGSSSSSRERLYGIHDNHGSKATKLTASEFNEVRSNSSPCKRISFRNRTNFLPFGNESTARTWSVASEATGFRSEISGVLLSGLPLSMLIICTLPTPSNQ